MTMGVITTVGVARHYKISRKNLFISEKIDIGMKYYNGDFNYLKLLFGLAGSLVILCGLFFHDIWYYSVAIGIGWFLICYAMSLHRYSETITDLNMERVWKTGISWVFLMLGTILLKNYKLRKGITLNNNQEFTWLLFFGVITSVLAKATFIAVELDLSHYTQYITILSIAFLSMGTIMSSMASGKLLFTLSFIYYLIGFLAFSVNLSYNPDVKIRGNYL